MPKRKRNDERLSRRSTKEAVAERLVYSKRILHRALKTAKNFERQKLGKRLTRAATAGEKARINREIGALKSLDLDKATDMHLHKTLFKIKAFKESGLLPDDVRVEKTTAQGESMIAMRNVLSGMLNTKTVKETINQVLRGVYVVMGIPLPSAANRKDKQEVKDAASLQSSDKIKLNQKDSGYIQSPLWDGFDSDENQDKQEASEDGSDDAGDVSVGEEDLARYDALLGASSDEESFDEKEYLPGDSPSTGREPLSLSPDYEDDSSSTLPIHSAESGSSSLEPETRVTKNKKTKAKSEPAKPGLSTFLPTLMGGYWSGSEESASDLEDFKPVKKNRPGQIARRALAERKFGERANHIKSGQGPVGRGRGKDDGWDARRGARDSSHRGTERWRKFGHGRAQWRIVDRSSQASGDNRDAIKPEARGMGKKDDVGILHPSWQAAKKAKEMKQTARFQGKKVVF